MGCHVLVVDDHAESAEGLAELLRLWGYEPHIALDGEEALDLACDVIPDVVITDIGLPGIDGHELARRLRVQPEARGMLLVALTGQTDTSEHQFAASGFDHHFVKPVDLDALERLLERRREQC